MSITSTERAQIPAELLDSALLFARLARRVIQPGIAEHQGTDLAHLAEEWASRLHHVNIGTEEPYLTQAEMDELRAVITEGLEGYGVQAADLDPDFVTNAERVLAFLKDTD